MPKTIGVLMGEWISVGDVLIQKGGHLRNNETREVRVERVGRLIVHTTGGRFYLESGRGAGNDYSASVRTRQQHEDEVLAAQLWERLAEFGLVKSHYQGGPNRITAAQLRAIINVLED